MTETLSESKKKLAAVLIALISGLAGIWWGLRIGDGLYYVTGINLRLFLSVLMSAGLLFQGYSSVKSSRKYSALYPVLLWISGILVSLLIYGLSVITLGDIIVVIMRFVLQVHCPPESGNSFLMLLFGVRPESAIQEYGFIWGSSVWNFENPSIIAALFSGILTVYGVIHARKITVRNYQIEPSKSGTKGCRIVQLSDLHIGAIVNSRYIHNVIEKTMELKPDYVVITGDIFNHGYVEEHRNSEKIEQDFRRLNESCGLKQNMPGKQNGQIPGRVFAILGNHDPEPSDRALLKFLEDSDITLLNDEMISLPEFDLAGRGSNHLNGRPALSSWLNPPEDQKPLIILDHYPDGIHEAEEEGADLMLCGHTHGGQYFPCNYLIRKRYSHGLVYGYSRWGKTDAIVSAGTGFFQIPIRIGTTSEIVCIDLGE